MLREDCSEEVISETFPNAEKKPELGREGLWQAEKQRPVWPEPQEEMGCKSGVIRDGVFPMAGLTQEEL